MQNLEWYLADLKSTGKNTIETVEKSLTDMFIRLVRIYPCLSCCILFLVRVHDLILREFRYNTESPALSFDVMEGHFVVQ